MTATYSSRRRADARYRGVVYGLDVIDHDTGQIVRNDYVGQTRQRGRGRENQHRDSQPWADLIVGSPRVLWEGLCTDVELDEMERLFIQEPPTGERPRLNWLLNEDNPRHVPKWVLVDQRHERDDREGRPRWVPVDERRREGLLEWESAPVQPTRQPKVRRPWSSRRRHLTGLGVAQAVLLLAGWLALLVYGQWRQETALAVVVASLVLPVWVWAGCPIRRRGRRKAAARVRKRLQWRRSR
ncbi:hypothetical protein FHR83_006736 [Actinoplanes campanulatus]|uniref:Uncharacterized protein n=1 Tax=Actinoplanes campanulatus TaxID=113559 RepID=A0A7W5AMT9_9ACTN|nr:hypothetical protein [Actinoplanes campanulatus]MBB3099030.1 hypothetical protein [Actinoplanes campanulatus]GGN39357.1 hypothetical protein GCM10010109_67200 [Actinoplanes campanulatus]GID40189.1 hypothetical protein Aca09nite_66950 [Actinoplanes campanulatus]